MRELLSFIPPMHPEGRRFVLIFAAVTLVLFFLWDPLGWLGVIATIWCGWFFRDPERVTPDRPGLVIAPADGIVNLITEAVPPAELSLGDKPLTRVSIFMNVFNCHIVRAPVDGAVIRTSYKPGRFYNASLEKASEENERYSILVRTGGSHEYGVVLVAGLVARRILPFVKQGAHLEPGDRIGLIRFGSRVDVYLPEGLDPLVMVGQTSVAGETVIADHRAHEGRRSGRRS